LLPKQRRRLPLLIGSPLDVGHADAHRRNGASRSKQLRRIKIVRAGCGEQPSKINDALKFDGSAVTSACSPRLRHRGEKTVARSAAGGAAT
jgi:hypothetical protein